MTEKGGHKGRILSGMRPTGKMHLGNFVGALENWVALQGKYENFHLIADYHALTTNLDTSHIFDNTIDMVTDWLSIGIDPERSPIFRQSQIKEHTELHLMFSMLITAARLERNPTLKEQIKDLKIENLAYGHLGYPVLQAADILLYKADLVPVGEDQAPHVEITREIARKFNSIYAQIFPLPKAKLTKFARLPGLDGRKMSKSLGNTILMSDSPEEIQKKIATAFTDPLKIHLGDPGHPEKCLVFTYHNKFNPDSVEEIASSCMSGKLGCVDCKKWCGEVIGKKFEPFRERRQYYAWHKEDVRDILVDGEKRARSVANETMSEVHAVMSLG